MSSSRVYKGAEKEDLTKENDKSIRQKDNQQCEECEVIMVKGWHYYQKKGLDHMLKYFRKVE